MLMRTVTVRFLYLLLLLAVGVSCTKKKRQQSKTISVGWDAAPVTIDSRYANDANSQYLEDLIHCSLLTFNEEGQLTGDLADTWKWVSPTQLQVKLKERFFSEATPVTASDVKATYDFFKTSAKIPSPRKGAFKNIKSIKADSPEQLTFELTQPDASFLTNLVVGVLPSADAIQPKFSNQSKPVGCGDYTLTYFGINKLELVPHAKNGAPKQHAVTIQFVEDETTSFSKLRNGELDVVQNSLSRDKVEDISKKTPQLVVQTKPGLNVTYLGFNFRDPTLANPLVRKAIAHAVDRKEIIRYVLKDLATNAHNLLLPEDPFADNNIKSPTYDLELARNLLNQAGFKDPDGEKGPQKRMKLSLKTTTNLTRITIAKALANQLSKIGIEVEVQPLEWGKFKQDVEKGRMQLWTLTWVGYKDPDMFRYIFASESFAPNGGNRGFYSNKALDKILEDGRTVPTTTERRAEYFKAQKIISDELPYVYLWHNKNFAVVNRKLTGFKIYADGRYSSLKNASKN